MQPASSTNLQASSVIRRMAGGWMERAWRGGSEAVLVRAAAVVAVGAVAAKLHSIQDPGVICPLRLLTGVPCPFCGSTSAVMALGTGDVVTAIRTQPLAMLGVAAVVTAPAGWFRARWEWTPYRRRVALLLGAVAVSWIYQLFRLGVI